ncbi:helix-turn-helix domain-containing protein [Fusobacterium polymorphum]|uniref:helix-turn-helix domain-containing protein n=1 Tax=Fusobacterium nucleatum subsp. polymorphum TaxID=76857 RepID=UPI00300B8CA2
MTKKYISVVQAANRLNVSISTIYNYCKIGTLGYRCIKNSKKYTWQIDLESLELLEENSTYKSTLQVKKDNQYSLF